MRWTTCCLLIVVAGCIDGVVVGRLGGAGSGGGVADRLEVDDGFCCDVGRVLCCWGGDGDTGSDRCSSRVVIRAEVLQRVFWDKYIAW